MKKYKINYLPAIPKSPEYLVRETYLEFLVDTMEVLQLPYIFVHADEQLCARI